MTDVRSVWRDTQSDDVYARLSNPRKKEKYESELELFTKKLVVGIIKADQDDRDVYNLS